MNTNGDLRLNELIKLVDSYLLSILTNNAPDNSSSMPKADLNSDQLKSNDETIKITNDNRRDDNMKNDSDYGKLYGKFMGCKCGDKDDDNCVSIYGCKCDKDCKCKDEWNDKCKCDDSPWDDDKWDDKWDDHKWDSKCDDDCKSLWSRKPCKCSDDVFEPICCNAICNVPRMDIIKMVAEGQGTIADNDAEPEEPEAGTGVGTGTGCKCRKGCKGGNGGNGEDAAIAFKFFIGKKYSNYVGSMCIVNFEDGIFLTSDKLECFHSPDHTKFIAIFHFEETNGMSREITVYGTTQICNILPTLFIFSAPHCGEEDALMMGGSVTTGTITIAKKDDKENEMMGH